VIQLALFSFFLYDYGLPAIRKHQEKKTLHLTSRKHTGGIEAPSITISVRRPESGIGWKKDVKNGSHDSDRLPHLCVDYTNIDQCIQNETYHHSTFIKGAVIGFEEKESLMNNEGAWTEDFSTVHYGRTYTLHPKRKIGPLPKDQIIIMLDHAFIYDIYVHDQGSRN
jgi:hypothetical protein